MHADQPVQHPYLAAGYTEQGTFAPEDACMRGLSVLCREILSTASLHFEADVPQDCTQHLIL